MTDDDQSLAMRYALGVADDREIAAVAARLDNDPIFRAMVDRFDEFFACLDGDIVDVTPPASLWSRIDSAISGASSVPQGSGAWESIAPGVERRALRADMPGLSPASLYRLAPGASLPPQPDSHISLLLRGEIDIGGEIATSIDAPVPVPTLREAPVHTRAGAVMYIRSF